MPWVQHGPERTPGPKKRGPHVPKNRCWLGGGGFNSLVNKYTPEESHGIEHGPDMDDNFPLQASSFQVSS